MGNSSWQIPGVVWLVEFGDAPAWDWLVSSLWNTSLNDSTVRFQVLDVVIVPTVPWHVSRFCSCLTRQGPNLSFSARFSAKFPYILWDIGQKQKEVSIAKMHASEASSCVWNFCHSWKQSFFFPIISPGIHWRPVFKFFFSLRRSLNIRNPGWNWVPLKNPIKIPTVQESATYEGVLRYWRKMFFYTDTKFRHFLHPSIPKLRDMLLWAYLYISLLSVPFGHLPEHDPRDTHHHQICRAGQKAPAESRWVLFPVIGGNA